MDDAGSRDLPTYLFEFGEETSYGSAIRLVTKAGSPGLVVDVGCGYAVVAERLVDAGWSYLGVDVDEAAVSHARRRGIEAHMVNLDRPALDIVSELDAVLDGREVRALFALDVLEHLPHPEECVQALAQLGGRFAGADLVVSLPNVTHVDVAAKLLAGRWETTPTGLLDRTHLRFFDECSATALLSGGGWREVDRDDVRTAVTEQASPPDLPTVRPGSPLNDLLRTVRGRAGRGEADTFQFVRRYQLGEEAEGRSQSEDDSDLVDVTVVAMPGTELDRLAGLLAAQVHRSFGICVWEAPDDCDLARLAADCGSPAGPVTACNSERELQRLRTRYLVAVGPGEQIAPHWIGSFVDGIEVAPGRVLIAGCLDPAGRTVPVARFDLIADGLDGHLVMAAYALPRMALVTGAVQLTGPLEDRVAALVRAMSWCGRYDLPTASVVTEVAEGGPNPAAICAQLDAEPLLLAPGAAGPLLAQRHQLLTAVHAKLEVEQAMASAETELAAHRAYHRAYAASAEALVEELRDELTRDPVARAITRLGRVIRRLARR